MYDLLGVGFVAVDDLLFVAAYPPPDSKARILRRARQCGGLTGTALVAAARLGMRCAYANVIGTDAHSEYVAQELAQAGIDLDWMARDPAAHVVTSMIVVDETHGARTIFYDLEGASGIRPEWPPPAAIQSARALYIDHLDGTRALRAARMAHAAGVPIIADAEYVSTPDFDELIGLVTHLILPAGFALRYTGQPDPQAAVAALWSPARAAVVVTCGADGAWWSERYAPQQVRHQAAFRVPVVDTTGCGDVFHGAYAAALLRGEATERRVRYAAAAAALKAMHPGPQAGIPDHETVESFVEEYIDEG